MRSYHFILPPVHIGIKSNCLRSDGKRVVEKVIWEVAGEDGDQDMMAIKEKEEKRKKEEKKLDWL